MLHMELLPGNFNLLSDTERKHMHSLSAAIDERREETKEKIRKENEVQSMYMYHALISAEAKSRNPKRRVFIRDGT